MLSPSIVLLSAWSPFFYFLFIYCIHFNVFTFLAQLFFVVICHLELVLRNFGSLINMVMNNNKV